MSASVSADSLDPCSPDTNKFPNRTNSPADELSNDDAATDVANRLYQHLGFQSTWPLLKSEAPPDTLAKMFDLFDEEVSQMEQNLILCLGLREKAQRALFAAEEDLEVSKQAADNMVRSAEVSIRKNLTQFQFYAKEAQTATDLYQSAYNRLVDIRLCLKGFGKVIPVRPALRI